MNNVGVEYVWQDRKRWLLFGLPFTFTQYKLTEEKLIVKTGVFTISHDEVRLYRMIDISLKRTLFQRLFGLGTIIVTSGDKSLGNFEIKNIKRPEYINELLSSMIERERVRKRVMGREFMDIDDDVYN